ncbi:TetR/AcrR family transcriptional regulator [Silvimonas iriomotensis]|uniref:TetR family transcriptional regulator n=1 Tax=Silvimonas iriomotensis TaxID=449662 RepID=A0ABQ2P3P5_9NEIS|nr:TetR/AcrR family transcriptional regulator [Silvimonas iriomotensis]GGP17532.1 TetR family transcriptional regulator [Silvimonas iriomotensis]
MIRTRPRGRPVAALDQNARALLLDAATNLFAHQGVAATTLAQVAQDAAVTPAMVHYYFKNRDQLLDAVVEERVWPFVELVWTPPAPDTDTTGVITDMVARMIGGAQTWPWLPLLWVREVLSEGGMLRERMMRRLPFDRVMQLSTLIADGQKQGRINPELEPRLLFITVLAMCMMPLATASIWRMRPGMQDIDNTVLVRHVTALLRHGMAGPGKE